MSEAVKVQACRACYVGSTPTLAPLGSRAEPLRVCNRAASKATDASGQHGQHPRTNDYADFVKRCFHAPIHYRYAV